MPLHISGTRNILPSSAVGNRKHLLKPIAPTSSILCHQLSSETTGLVHKRARHYDDAITIFKKVAT